MPISYELLLNLNYLRLTIYNQIIKLKSFDFTETIMKIKN